MRALVIGLLIAPILAVIGIVNLESLNSNGTVLTVQWLLTAFVPLDLLALIFVTIAWLWSVRRPGLRWVIRVVLTSAYLFIGPVGYLQAGAWYAQEMAEYDPSDDCRVLFGDCVPDDGRFGWVVAWAIFGLLSCAAAGFQARRIREC